MRKPLHATFGPVDLRPGEMLHLTSTFNDDGELELHVVEVDRGSEVPPKPTGVEFSSQGYARQLISWTPRKPWWRRLFRHG